MNIEKLQQFMSLNIDDTVFEKSIRSEDLYLDCTKNIKSQFDSSIILNRNKINMQTSKERNPYLKRIFSETPHKYSYDMDAGKYFLITPQGKQKEIYKTGTFKSKFRRNFTGFCNHKQRYQEAKNDFTALHYVPDQTFDEKNAYYYPMLQKFAGYAQYPYKTGPFPEHLKPPGIIPKAQLRKSQSHSYREKKNSQQQKVKSKSIILQSSTSTFIKDGAEDKFFQSSFFNMTHTKPLPKQAKRTCYNYKCKYMKQFVFDEKQKTEASTRFTLTSNRMGNTMGRSFHQKKLGLESQQASLIQNICD